MAVTLSAVGAMTGSFATDGLGLSLAIYFCWMRDAVHRLRAECVIILLHGNAKKNGRLGRDGVYRTCFRYFRAADVPPRRAHGGRQESCGFRHGDRRQAGPPERFARQGRGAEFLGKLVSTLRRRNSVS